MVSNKRKDIRGARSGASSAAAHDIPSVQAAPLMMIHKRAELSVTGPPSLVSSELNCCEINPLEKDEHLRTLVRIPSKITFTKDIPPFSVGTLTIENNSNEDLIFEVKTKTETAQNIYEITPNFGTLIKNSSIEIKVQADFTKGLSPSLDMTSKNIVVLLYKAPKSKMTREDLEQFRKLLQDQQDDGNPVAEPDSSSSDDVLVPEELSLSAAFPPFLDAAHTAELIDAVFEDVRTMSGNMNSMLRWGSIATYVCSAVGIITLLYNNMKDASETPEWNNRGFMNMVSSADKKEP